MPITTLQLKVGQRGFLDFTEQVSDFVHQNQIQEGLCTLFIRHTSASLLIQESADPDVRHDLENWFSRLVPDGDPMYTHNNEGADDMPGHIRSMLTATSLSIPILNGSLVLGTWQAIYLWEHRRRNINREVVLHVSR